MNQDDLADGTRLPVTQEGVELVHPVYLDVPMMINFLAAAEGGVSFSSAETITRRDSRSREGGAKLTIAGIAGLLGLSLSGAQKSDIEVTEETKLERQFTTASLFSLLRARLTFDLGVVKTLRDPNDLTSLAPGMLVEISGKVTSDPVQRALAAVLELTTLTSDILAIQPFGSLLETYLAGRQDSQSLAQALGWNPPVQEAPTPRSPSGARQQHPAGSQTARARGQTHVKAEDLAGQIAGFLRRVTDSAVTNAVTDYTIETPDRVLRGVLTMSTAFLPPESGLMLDSEMTVIGKLTRVLHESDSVDLLRRSVLGYFPTDRVRQILDTLDSALRLSLPNVVVLGPGIQVIPLAVFI